MNRMIQLTMILLLLAPALVTAHGPSRQKVVEEIEISASPDKVWAIVSEFCSIKDWHPMVTACESDKGTAVDSVRVITLENGAAVKEKLARHFPDRRRLQYMMIEPSPEAFPINTHGTGIIVKEGAEGGAVVEWKGAFYRAFPGPNPPPELSDEAGREKITAFYRSGLENLKQLAEQ
ncbi:MAG: SRPBCC family protein [Gammaproteobacteria bacterium]